jgi:hypothetical protein
MGHALTRGSFDGLWPGLLNAQNIFHAGMPIMVLAVVTVAGGRGFMYVLCRPYSPDRSSRAYSHATMLAEFWATLPQCVGTCPPPPPNQMFNYILDHN